LTKPLNSMPQSPKPESVLFICSYLTEDIVRERGLPFLNLAGSNRSVRIAEALRAAGAEVLMLSSATTMRQKYTKEIFHQGREIQKGAIRVVFPWSVGLPFLGTLFEPLALALGVKQAFKTRRPTIVLLYNYYPAPLLAALLSKYLFGAKMILEIEDVYTPRIGDWFGRGDARPIQQLVCWILLRIGIAACDSVVVPSRRFLSAARVHKKHTIVSGCIEVDRSAAGMQNNAGGPLMILVGGKLDDEQGLSLVIEAIDLVVKNRQLCQSLDFHFCGFTQNEKELKDRLQALSMKGASVRYHGTVTLDEYRSLLSRSNVCVAMPNPGGRHAETNTPSKVYEYLAYGKAVITSDVGDFREIPADAISLCDWDAVALSLRLKEFANDRESVRHMGERAAELAAAEYAPAANGVRILSSVQ